MNFAKFSFLQSVFNITESTASDMFLSESPAFYSGRIQSKINLHVNMKSAVIVRCEFKTLDFRVCSQTRKIELGGKLKSITQSENIFTCM